MQIAVDNQQLVTEAYLYGFPLVFNLDQVQRYVTDGVGANPAAPFNTFSHARALAGPDDTFVTDQQRHRVLDGAARPERGTGRVACP